MGRVAFKPLIFMLYEKTKRIKMKNIFLALIVSLSLAFPVFAEKITLKSGKTLEGKIIQETDSFIKVDFSGILLTYYKDDIANIEKSTSNTQIKHNQEKQDMDYGETTKDQQWEEKMIEERINMEKKQIEAQIEAYEGRIKQLKEWIKEYEEGDEDYVMTEEEIKMYEKRIEEKKKRIEKDKKYMDHFKKRLKN
ncbi:MAG: hypothetical protein JSW40_02190 [Candidatus Omnitrophota bacterium]|nr:MAG: hypothetical protein JSW40_02190 [Candidatus Omnitrophota bacterium]